MQSQPQISQDLFINRGVNLQLGDSEYITMVNLSKARLKNRWSTQQGQFILNKWKANNFNRQILDDLVGKIYDHTDIRGISLARETVRGVDLSNVELYGSDLEGTIFSQVDLTNSYFSETNIKDAKFEWAKMDGVLIDNVDFNNKTSFFGVNLNAINFNLAVMLQDLAIGQQRIAHLERRQPNLAALLRVTCDYGRSFRRFLVWCVAIVFLFAVVYWLVPGALSKPGFANSLYFSAMTFTTLGSDVQAASPLGKILVVVEATIGYLMTGLLVAILIKRTIAD